MAAGTRAAPVSSLESTLDRKLQSLSNTMDSVQGLSNWCIENKKYHSVVVREWMKCLRKSDASHKLNLLYLANDVIQNCKRKNAIVYRTAFAEVLPDAFLLFNFEGDPKVIKSVERILSIWEDRSVYSGTLITDLRGILIKEESPPVTPVEQKTPVESKADLRSKIVAEFVPQVLIEQLSKYKRSVEEVDLREKQLAAMRVDIFSSDALRRLKDKAGGKKFSRDFEEGSTQLQEFVKFFDKENKIGPPLLEALSHADIFYEMQYKEVKIVANAYQTFANRVSHLKRKLDSLKATLPDLDESPIPSPSADAPSPTGSESPFRGLELAHPDPDLDGSAMDDDAEPPAPSPLSSPGASPKPAKTVGDADNREVEDMELSEDEMDSGGIIVEENNLSVPELETPAPIPEKNDPSVTTEQPVTQVSPAAAPPEVPPATPAVATPVSVPVAAPVAVLENVDMGKIGSILNSLSSVLKNTGPLVESSPPSAPVVPPVKTPPVTPVVPQDASSLVNLLSKVDVSPADLLSALSKVQSQSSVVGISSLLDSPSANAPSDSSNTVKITPSDASSSALPSQSLPPSFVTPLPPSSNTSHAASSTLSIPTPPQIPNPASALVQALHRDMDLTTEQEPEPEQELEPEPKQSISSTSLESKIHSFLQGNPAFNALDLLFPSNPVPGGNNFSPVTGTDTQDGTPVRDEGGGTPTQDEIMDKAVVVPFASNMNQLSVGEGTNTAPVTYPSSTHQNPINAQQPAHQQPGVAQNAQVYPQYPYGKQEMSAPVGHYQQLPIQTGGAMPGEKALGSANSTQTVQGFQGASERSWYGDTYPEGRLQQPASSFNLAGGVRENSTSGIYQAKQTLESQEPVSQQGNTIPPTLFQSTLPPVPKLPPPPQGFIPSSTSSMTIPPEQQTVPSTDAGGVIRPRSDSAIGGTVVHDHQHKPFFHPDEPQHDTDQHLPHHSEDFHRHPDDMRYHGDISHYNNELPPHDAPFLPDNPYHHPDDPFHRPDSPPHPYPRAQGRLTPPLSPVEDPFYAHDYLQQGPRPPHHLPRRPPPHHEIRHPGMRRPLRPLHPVRHPPPRGPPRPQFPRFHRPELRLRHLGPRGGGPLFPPKRPYLPPRY
ncbi:regulation of nuclear pre-mRNA domain-containing protein 2a isoform 1-T1 [Pholidichthys leucotaenia]